MLNNDYLITYMLLDNVLQPSYSNNLGGTFLELFVKNVAGLDVPEIELDWAELGFSYNIRKRSSCIRILTEHNFISLRLNFKNINKDWRVCHYIGERMPQCIAECVSLSEDEMFNEKKVPFSEIKNWLSQCINTPRAENCSQLNELLSLLEQSASHPFVKNLLINIDDFFSCILDKVLISMLRAVLWLGKMLWLGKRKFKEGRMTHA